MNEVADIPEAVKAEIQGRQTNNDEQKRISSQDEKNKHHTQRLPHIKHTHTVVSSLGVEQRARDGG